MTVPTSNRFDSVASAGASTGIAGLVPVVTIRAPSSRDIRGPNGPFKVGQNWVDTVVNSTYILTSYTPSNGAMLANWAVTGATSTLATLTGDTGGATSPINGNIDILGIDTLTVDGSSGTLTITPSIAGYPVTPYVVGPSGAAGYQTIQTAVTAANAAGGGIVLVQPGTYTENLTLYNGVHILGLTFADAGGGVNIIGKHVPPATGGFVFRNVRLTSATHIFDSNAAGSAHLVLGDAEIFVTNGYTFNLPNWTGKLESFDVNAAVGTNDGYVNNTGGAEVDLFEVSVGSGSANPMIVSGFTLGAGANIYCPIDFRTGANAEFDYCLFDNPVTLSNNSAGTVTTSHFSTGASASITMSSSGSWNIYTSLIESSNNPAIAGAGAGTLKLGDVTFSGNSTLAGTLTTAWGATKTGAFTSATSLTASNGNLVFGTAGNKISSTSVGSTTTAGANSFGTVALSSGAAVVSTTAVTASSIIYLTVQALGTVSVAKAVAVTAKTASTSFTITSADATDTSTIAWMIVN